MCWRAVERIGARRAPAPRHNAPTMHPTMHPLNPNHNPQMVQQLYEECQATMDPNAIAGLLHSHPYHLDSLLTMQDLYRSMGEHAQAGARACSCAVWTCMRARGLVGVCRLRRAGVRVRVRSSKARSPAHPARPPHNAHTRARTHAHTQRPPPTHPDEMLERCVYALEMAWHPSFSPAAASASIEYTEQNAPLFIALFRQGDPHGWVALGRAQRIVWGRTCAPTHPPTRAASTPTHSAAAPPPHAPHAPPLALPAGTPRALGGGGCTPRRWRFASCCWG